MKSGSSFTSPRKKTVIPLIRHRALAYRVQFHLFTVQLNHLSRRFNSENWSSHQDPAIFMKIDLYPQQYFNQISNYESKWRIHIYLRPIRLSTLSTWCCIETRRRSNLLWKGQVLLCTLQKGDPSLTVTAALFSSLRNQWSDHCPDHCVRQIVRACLTVGP